MVLTKDQQKMVSELTRMFKIHSFTSTSMILDVEDANVSHVFIGFEPTEMCIGETRYQSSFDFMRDCRSIAGTKPTLQDIVADWISRDQLSFGAMVQLTKSEAQQVLKDMAAMKLEEVANV